MKYINNKKIEDKDPHEDLPSKANEIKSHINDLEKYVKNFEVDFKKFDKTGISREFLYLNWNFKEYLEKWLENYHVVNGTLYGSVGRPSSDNIKILAKKYVDEYQKRIQDDTKYPTAIALKNALTPQIDDLVLQGITAIDISTRTCSDWLTQMRRGTFRIKSQEDPWAWLDE